MPDRASTARSRALRWIRGAGAAVRALWCAVDERRQQAAGVGVFAGAVLVFLLAHRRYVASLPHSYGS